MLFREALEELKDRHLGRLSVFHVLSQEEQDIPVLNGRIDADRVRLLLRHVVPAAGVDHVFLCGPAGMLDAVEPVLAELGMPPERVHVERFVSAGGGCPAPAPPAGAPAAHTASLIVDGNRRDVPVADGETRAGCGAARRDGPAVRLQGRHVQHLPRPGGGGRGGDGGQLLAGAVGDAGRVRADLPGAPDHAARGDRLRRGVRRATRTWPERNARAAMGCLMIRFVTIGVALGPVRRPGLGAEEGPRGRSRPGARTVRCRARAERRHADLRPGHDQLRHLPQRPLLRINADGWLLGFWTGSNRKNPATHSVGQSTDSRGIVGEVALACRGKPSTTLFDTAKLVYDRMAAENR